MIYIFFEFDEIKYWIEVANDGYACMQIICENGVYHLSCRTDCLAEGMVDTENDCEQITLKLFDEIWNENSIDIQGIWEVEKHKYSIGTVVKGIIKYFYPQGVIFDIDNIQGCADYTSCKENSHSTSLYPNHLITGIVSGYDEVNKWILLSDCKAL